MSICSLLLCFNMSLTIMDHIILRHCYYPPPGTAHQSTIYFCRSCIMTFHPTHLNFTLTKIAEMLRYFLVFWPFLKVTWFIPFEWNIWHEIAKSSNSLVILRSPFVINYATSSVTRAGGIHDLHLCCLSIYPYISTNRNSIYIPLLFFAVWVLCLSLFQSEYQISAFTWSHLFLCVHTS